MPTGSASGLYANKDIEFKEFVLKCAGQFSPFDAHDPITNNRYEAQLQTARASVAATEQWDEAEADLQAQLDYERRCDEHQKELRKQRKLRKNYEAMLARVMAWTPPTPRHQGLKEYMVNQLKQSIKVDCNTNNLTMPQRLSGVIYKEQRLQVLEIYIASVMAIRESEISRATDRRDWFLTLRQSLTESTGKAKAS